MVLWIAADDSVKLSEGFVEAGAKLDLHQPNANAKTDRDSVKGWLEKTSECQHRSKWTATDSVCTAEPWLIGFDNVESTDDLHEYIPSPETALV